MDTRRNPEKRFVLPPPASATLFSLRHCAAMGLWEEGMETAAEISEPDNLERREGAGRFYLALMQALTATGTMPGRSTRGSCCAGSGRKGVVFPLILLPPENLLYPMHTNTEVFR